MSAALAPAEIAHHDLANAIRALAMDAVEAAKSGHPGMPMGMADVATVLATRFLKIDPADPSWPDRDRLVLSAGHGSMLLYALGFLLGYEEMTLDQIRRFRQLHSRTPGHPEVDRAIGVETTTGPLGQGLATAVGMALAERILHERFGADLVDHRTWVIASDGDLMEGVSHEAAALAGHLGLGRLVVLFDDNGISIDGPTDLAVSEDTQARFRAYGWQVAACDGHDPQAVAAAITAVLADDSRPALIACRTVIGFGAPGKAGTAGAHGSPLGAEEIDRARAQLGWPHAPFVVPEPVLSAWRAAGARGRDQRLAWAARHAAAPMAPAFDAALGGAMPATAVSAFETVMDGFRAAAPKLATRQASGQVLDHLIPAWPELMGGSADLTGSNNTQVRNTGAIARGRFTGRYIHFGVREHAMAAAMNGMALHGGVVPYGGTFLTFSDYSRPAIRLSALMRQRVVHVMTHDSIGLGEDGPTHQPVEHLAALRAIPNLLVLRPADALETAECWQIALSQVTRPSVLVLTRQALPALPRAAGDGNRSARGGYVVVEAEGQRQVTLIGTGSEVEIALAARTLLAERGIQAAVVSMPSRELFESEGEAYRTQVVPPDLVTVVVEAAVRQGWEGYTGRGGAFVGLSTFGESAPYMDLYRHFGITAEAVADAAAARLGAALT